MSEQTTTAQLIAKHPQFVAETTEGTKVTASPNYTSLGVVKSIAIKINGNFVDISQVASEDLIDIIQGMQEYETQYTMTVQNITSILDRLIDPANFATPVGTVSETLNIVFSVYHDGTEKYIFCLGSRLKEGSVTMETGKETEVSVTFTHTSITTPNATSGLTTPTHATLPTGAVLGWMDGGADPISWNAVGLNCKKFSFNINRNSKTDHTLGNLDPYSSQPHGRRITGDFTVLWTNTTLETDFKAGTARALVATIDTGVGVITITGAKIVDYARDEGSDDEDSVIEQCTYRALSVGIAP